MLKKVMLTIVIIAIVMASFTVGAIAIDENRYHVYTNNKSGPGYGKVYNAPSFRSERQCQNVVDTVFKPKAIKDEVFYCSND